MAPHRIPAVSTHPDDKITGKAYDARLLARLWRYVRPYRLQVAASLFLLGLVSVFQLAQPLLIRLAIDRYVASGNLHGLDLAAAGFLFCLGGEALFRYLQVNVMLVAGQRVVFDLRMDLFAHIQRMDASFFDRNPVGRLITRATTDVESIEEMFSSGVIAIVGDLLRLLAIMALMAWLEWRLALVIFTVIPVMLGVSLGFRARIRDTYRDIRARLARINAYLQENVLGMKVVKLFAQEGRAGREFDELNRDHRDAELRGVFYESAFSAWVEFMGVLAAALVVWWGGGQVIRGALTFGTLFAFFAYVEKFFLPLQDLAVKYTFLQSAMASSERVFHLLDQEPAIRSPEPIRPLPAGAPRGRVELRGVRFSYVEGEEVLRGVDLAVETGEHVAVVGPTGSGKTTIARLLTRLYEAGEGQVLVDGMDVRDWDLRELRRRVGIVLQDPFLFSGTVLDNIRLFDTTVSRERVEEAARVVNAHPFIRRFPDGYDHRVLERGLNLSAGQRQLVAFARVLVYDPEILVLDEATSSVDTETEEAIQAGLRELVKGRTSLIIAHRLSTIRSADRILVFSHGRLREEGTHQELLARKGIYTRLYRLQVLDEGLERE